MYYISAAKVLINFLENTDKYDWEICAVSAFALQSYPGERTCETLLKCLSCPNWYIRFNAAESLYMLHQDCDRLHVKYVIDDRDAMEMLKFRMNFNKVKNVYEIKEG